ncbi:hypothetical protein ACVIGB_000620 [Bradyrhizobium sp. USDA 4341]
MLKKTTEHTRGIFTIKECRYDSKLIEISFYVPPCLPGAGPVLRGVVSRQGPGCKYVAYTNLRNRVAIGLKKETVIATTIAEIERDMHQDGSLRFYGQTGSQNRQI